MVKRRVRTRGWKSPQGAGNPLKGISVDRRFPVISS